MNTQILFAVLPFIAILAALLVHTERRSKAERRKSRILLTLAAGR